jgi:membrane peptidoglycan carboxypeptidase
VTYLQIVAALHAEYKDLPQAELDAIKPEKDDRLTAWAVDYLRNAKDYRLDAMLEAAMQRRYSASPYEGFFTGGGLHHFENFDRKDNGRILTVREALQRSVNLVFIRLIRDVAHYHMFRVPGSSPRILADANDPRRQAYLTRFADEESKVFLQRFHETYRGQTADQALDTLLDGPRMTPKRAAVIFGSLRPRGSAEQFADLLARRLPESRLERKEIERLFEKYGPGKFNLSDSGYLARVHPLELWLLRDLSEHPKAELSEVLARGAAVRQEIYSWLTETKHKGAQDLRIRILLEKDAFKEIHRAWRQVGYPFESLVASYATTIGSSGDTPAALAELMGIIVNGGVRYPTMRIRQLHFAAATPHETLLEREIPAGRRVLQPEVAALVRQELIGVVERGTGRRAYGAILLDGEPVEIGGKTGTGDNRFESYAPGGRRIDSRVVNRTATFVFLIGDRFFGTVTAHVSGEEAAAYSFTSALPVQVLRRLLPSLKPLLERAPEGRNNTILASVRENAGL